MKGARLSVVSLAMRGCARFASAGAMACVVSACGGSIAPAFRADGSTSVLGEERLALRDASHNRDIQTVVYYSAAPSAKPEPFAVRPIFKSISLAYAAPPMDTKRKPLIVFSHGYWGTPWAQAWLAQRLIADGYLVASVTHLGSNADAQTVEGRHALWQRPLDVSFVLSELLRDPVWAARIDAEHIGFAGHSFGAWTGLALAGAVDHHAEQLNACRLNPARDFYCKNIVVDSLAGLNWDGDGKSYADPRFTAFVLMAPGPTQGFTERSLAAIAAPFFVLSATRDEVLEYHANVARLLHWVPKLREQPIDTNHFAFIPECNLLGKIVKGDLCGEEGLRRSAVHAQAASEISSYFTHAFAEPIVAKPQIEIGAE